jgi:lysozyme family protein
VGAAVTASNFKPSLTYTLAFEGGYVNHPKDPGGPTNRGITQAVYDAYRKLNGLAPKSVSLISLGEVAAIYKQQYWNAVLGDSLPIGVDYAVFDFAVNSGVARASRYLQLALGVMADGHIGYQTQVALGQADPQALIIRLCADRMAFLKGLDTYATFGKGWARRVIGAQSGYQKDDTGVIDYAMNMAGAQLSMQPPKPIGALIGEPQTAKAVNDDLAFMPTRPMSYGELKSNRWAA